MEIAIEKIAAACFIVIGVSHVFQPRGWVRFFVQLREKGEPGAFINGFLSLGLGALVVGFHNVWSGIPLVLTIIGYGQLLKAFRCFVFPQSSLRMMAWVDTDEKAWKFVVGGLILTAIGALLLYDALT